MAESRALKNSTLVSPVVFAAANVAAATTWLSLASLFLGRNTPPTLSSSSHLTVPLLLRLPFPLLLTPYPFRLAPVYLLF